MSMPAVTLETTINTVELLEESITVSFSVPGQVQVATLGIAGPQGQQGIQGPPGADEWGAITGTLANQTDLAAALNGKLSLGGGTMTGPLNLAGYGLREVMPGVITVNAAGGADYTTITAALAAAASGDTVYVWPGSYTGNVVIPAGVALVGAGAGVTLIIAPSGSRGPTVTLGANTALSGFTVQGIDWTYTLIAWAAGGGGATIVDCALTMATGNPVAHYAIDATNWCAGNTGSLTISATAITMASVGADTGQSTYGVYIPTSPNAHGGAVSITDSAVMLDYLTASGSALYYGNGNYGNGSASFSGLTLAAYSGAAYAAYCAVSTIVLVGTVCSGATYHVVRATEYPLLGQLNAANGSGYASASAAGVPFSLRGAAAQSADLTQWQNSSGAVLSGVNAAGQPYLPTTTGMPANTPANGAMAYDPAAGKLWIYSTALGWKGTVLS